MQCTCTPSAFPRNGAWFIPSCLVRALLRPQPPCYPSRDSILLNIVRSLSRRHQSAIKAGSKTDQVGVREIQFPIRNAVGGERIPSPKVGGVLDDMIPVRQSRHFQVKESGFNSRLQSDNRAPRRVKRL